MWRYNLNQKNIDKAKKFLKGTNKTEPSFLKKFKGTIKKGHLYLDGKIVVPTIVHKNKVNNILNFGGKVEYHGDDCLIAEERAQEISKTTGATYISPYNDPAIICGQGTMGYEIDQDLKNIDSVFVSVGGGGLISGVGGYLKSVQKNVKMVAVSPKNSCVMYESIKAGKQLDLPSDPTLSDGTAGGVEMGSITFELCQRIIDEFILVTEDEIADGHGAADNARARHQHGEGHADGDDGALADVQVGQRRLALDGGALIAPERGIEAVGFVLLVTEVFYRLEIQQAVDGLGVGL